MSESENDSDSDDDSSDSDTDTDNEFDDFSDVRNRVKYGQLNGILHRSMVNAVKIVKEVGTVARIRSMARSDDGENKFNSFMTRARNKIERIKRDNKIEEYVDTPSRSLQIFRSYQLETTPSHSCKSQQRSYQTHSISSRSLLHPLE